MAAGPQEAEAGAQSSVTLEGVAMCNIMGVVLYCGSRDVLWIMLCRAVQCAAVAPFVLHSCAALWSHVRVKAGGEGEKRQRDKTKSDMHLQLRKKTERKWRVSVFCMAPEMRS